MELSIDTASEMASLALSREGVLQAEITWRCRRNHTVELLPTIEKLLCHGEAKKQDLTAIFVCLGPGMYTGLRVGISTAQGLAFALRLPVVGVGRLELDACPHAAYPGPVVPLHAAGRGEVAWAVYEAAPDGLREVAAPRLSRPEDLVRQAPDRALFCGDVSGELSRLLHATLPAARIAAGAPPRAGRAAFLAEIGYRRLQAGGAVEPAALRPLYLREPAIGPQTSGS